MSSKASRSASGGLSGLAQHQAAVGAPPRQVAALAVVLGAVGRLRQERQPLARRTSRGCAGRAPRPGCPSSTGTGSGSRARAAARASRRWRATCTRRRGRAAPTRARGRPATRRARGRPRAASAPCPGRSRAAGRRPAARGSARAPRACRRASRSCSSAAAGCARRGARAGAGPGARSRRGTMSPSFTSISDLALVMPMLVPSPPFSLSTTACPSAAPSPVAQLGRVGQLVERLDLATRAGALLAVAHALLVVGESLDGDLRQPLGAHLVHSPAHRRAILVACPRDRARHRGRPTRADPAHARLLRLLRGRPRATRRCSPCHAS